MLRSFLISPASASEAVPASRRALVGALLAQGDLNGSECSRTHTRNVPDPFLPYLIKGGEKAAEEAGAKFGTAAWERAKMLWRKLHPTGADIFTLTGHTGPTFGVAFSANGKALVTSSVDRTVKVWQLPRPGEPVAEPMTLYGNSGSVYRVAFSPDGARLASSGRDHIAHLYDLDIHDLAAIAQARLTRTLTPEECQKYLHTAQCPTLKANQ